MLTLDIEELIVESDEMINSHYFIHCHVKDHCCACPRCGQLSTRVHAYYDRVIQDLPINGKSVYLKIRCRKLLCLNEECTKKIFAQQIRCVRPKSKKTDRLEKVILKIATDTSLIEASRTLRQLGIIASKSSIAELLKKNRDFC
ncbi:transposase family protein [Enterococcus sp. DIV0098]|uniref:transposase family protein n=1 Tax=Enterococcus sp. DIV0098 TaxID=2774843 RepID=UPI003F1FD30C